MKRYHRVKARLASVMALAQPVRLPTSRSKGGRRGWKHVCDAALVELGNIGEELRSLAEDAAASQRRLSDPHPLSHAGVAPRGAASTGTVGGGVGVGVGGSAERAGVAGTTSSSADDRRDSIATAHTSTTGATVGMGTDSANIEYVVRGHGCTGRGVPNGV